MSEDIKYQVFVLSPNDGTTVAFFDGASFYELRYSRALDDVGVIAITVPSTAANRAAFQLDSFVEVYRTNPVTGKFQKEETYFARLFHRFREGDEEKFLVGGFSLNHLMKRRVVDPTEDGTAADGYSSKSGPADTVIQSYCVQQMGPTASLARRVPNLTFGGSAGVGIPVSASLRYTELYQEMFNLAMVGAVDFMIERTSLNNLLMTVAPIGSDLTKDANYPIRPWVGLSPIRGNLSDPSYVVDRQDEKTVIYTLGQGQGLQRDLFVMANSGLGDSPYNRIEVYQDARTIDKGDDTALTNISGAQLVALQAKRQFSYNLLGNQGGNTYRLDWDLGDLVTAFWDESSMDLRIWGVDIQVDSGGELITVDAHAPQLN